MGILKALEIVKEYCNTIHHDNNKICNEHCSIYKVLGKCILK